MLQRKMNEKQQPAGAPVAKGAPLPTPAGMSPESAAVAAPQNQPGMMARAGNWFGGLFNMGAAGG